MRQRPPLICLHVTGQPGFQMTLYELIRRDEFRLPTRWDLPMINKFCCSIQWDTPRTTLKFKAQQRKM